MSGASGANDDKQEKKEGEEEFFKPLDADDNEVTEIESLCLNCEKQGTTKLMLTRIPFFREVIVSSFRCPHCHFNNSELSSAMETAEQGIEYVLNVKEKLDLNRLVVKSDCASVAIPELDLEIPAKTQKGDITTVEGILTRVVSGLRQDQPRRKDEHEDDYEKIEAYLKKIEDCLELKTEFSLNIRDITGNSFIGTRPTPLLILDDPNLHSKKFSRTKEEDKSLGIGMQDCPVLQEEPEETEEGPIDLKDEVLQMSTNCPECNAPCVTKMKVTEIPLFKEVIIMATDCDKCGSRTNEVKSGGGIEPKGKRVKLRVKSKEDFSRDVLKSDTCFIAIPDLQILAGSGTIVGKFTTVEGLILDMKKQLSADNPFIGGDSADPSVKGKMKQLGKDLDLLLSGEKEFTIILDDPAGNVYIQNLYAPDEDPEMATEEYERTFEQNEELGLNDMNVGEQPTPES